MKLLRVPHAKNKSPEESSGHLQTLHRKLAQNALTEFKVGFEKDEFRSKKDVQAIIHTIQEEYWHRLAVDKVSCLMSIRIGWMLPHFARVPVLQEIVPMLLKQPANVQHLQLVIYSWVPLPTIQRLVSWHTLETLDLRSVRVQPRAVSEPSRLGAGHRHVDRGSSSHRRHSASPSPTSSVKTDVSSNDEGMMLEDDSVLNALPYISSSIKTLKLVDCDLKVDHLADMICILRKKHNLQCLSLRNNRYLYIDGWVNDLFEKLPFLKGLDLSICDLDPVDGLNLATSLEAHPDARLESLNISGNFRLGKGIPDIVHACILSGVRELECSYCNINSSVVQETIFEMLANKKPCSLRSLTMHGTRISSISALIRCIEQNESLERLVLNHPKEPGAVSSQNLELILAAVRNNYYLCDLQIDLPWRSDNTVLKELNYWLTLNRCGRRILVNDSRRNWLKVITAVDRWGDIDALHWILRRGAEQFHTLEVS